MAHKILRKEQKRRKNTAKKYTAETSSHPWGEVVKGSCQTHGHTIREKKRIESKSFNEITQYERLLLNEAAKKLGKE